jgi:hypothetical protein
MSSRTKNCDTEKKRKIENEEIIRKRMNEREGERGELKMMMTLICVNRDVSVDTTLTLTLIESSNVPTESM